ncbi:hypothetical protein [Micromonospora sp. NBC_01796]|uniref:hypothetical protein n=1 Tax=Micromonospora sp. NBC_01796 TaxID=2975987 RepID=UPI002DDA2EC5|nr:hypothetical protein [Micromonospora sp. NBC_01796]WSA89164.1 hypothetical protein OIE47_17045 [Micromonospora sp. NBC_01796]
MTLTELDTDPRPDLAAGPARPGGRRLRGVRRRRLRRLLVPTPNRFVLVGIMLVLLFALTAGIAGLAARAAVDAGEVMVTSAAQMSGNAQAMHRWLAEADAAATGRFLAPPDSGQRVQLNRNYEDALGEVRRLLAESAGLTGGDPDRATGLARVANQLPVYTDLVRRAQELGAEPADRRLDALLGSAYLREASGYLRGVLLPAAQQLWEDETTRLSEARRDGQLALFGSIGITLLTLVPLWWSQRYLRRRTKRRVNPGLALATAAMLATTGWLVVSWRHWPQAEERLTVAGRKLDQHRDLIEIQRDALRARADVHLRLGGNSNQYGMVALNERFRRDAHCDSTVAGFTDQMRVLVGVWCTGHDRYIVENERLGAHPAAVAAALPGGEVATAFTHYDTELTKEINRVDREIYQELTNTPPAPTSLGVVTLLLCLIGAAGVAVGIGVRVREYR